MKKTETGIAEITDSILRNRKYSGLDRTLVERLCAEYIHRYKIQKQAVKAVKNELHIIHESFIPEGSHAKAGTMLDAYTGGDISTDKDFCTRLMSLHASTRERLGEADKIYAFLCNYIEEKDSIIDMGCGFNPMALPFFTVRPKNYAAFDISLSTVNMVEKYFNLAGLGFQTGILDAAVQTPDTQGHVLFMFKLFPLLERRKKGRSFEIIKLSKCRKIIVSFPTKSASGREKGMEAFYSSQFENNLPADLAIIEKAVFKNEMFYVINSSF